MPHAELAKNGASGTHRFLCAGCDGVPFNSDTWEAAGVEGQGEKEVEKKALTYFRLFF